MKAIIQATAVIRQRGQITIPEKIRKYAPWLVPGCVVNLTVFAGKKELVITPYAGIANTPKKREFCVKK